MLEIETAGGWERIPLQAEADDYFSGAPVHVAEEPTLIGFQALRRVGSAPVAFRSGGSVVRCTATFDDTPIFEPEKIPYCVLRLQRSA